MKRRRVAIAADVTAVRERLHGAAETLCSMEHDRVVAAEALARLRARHTLVHQRMQNRGLVAEIEAAERRVLSADLKVQTAKDAKASRAAVTAKHDAETQLRTLRDTQAQRLSEESTAIAQFDAQLTTLRAERAGVVAHREALALAGEDDVVLVLSQLVQRALGDPERASDAAVDAAVASARDAAAAAARPATRALSKREGDVDAAVRQAAVEAEAAGIAAARAEELWRRARTLLRQLHGAVLQAEAAHAAQDMSPRAAAAAAAAAGSGAVKGVRPVASTDSKKKVPVAAAAAALSHSGAAAARDERDAAVLAAVEAAIVADRAASTLHLSRLAAAESVAHLKFGGDAGAGAGSSRQNGTRLQAELARLSRERDTLLALQANRSASYDQELLDSLARCMAAPGDLVAGW